MATHSRILAWIIQWTEEPGGSHTAGQDCSDLAIMHLSLYKEVERNQPCLLGQQTNLPPGTVQGDKKLSILRV